MPASIAMARTAAGGFDPLTDLPGLQWLIHPDDAAGGDIVSGEINTLTEREAAEVFSAAAAANRMPRDFSGQRANHATAQSVVGGSNWIRAADATLANSISGACTLFSFQAFSTSGGTNVACSHNNSTAGPGFTTQHIALALVSSAMTLSTRDGGGTTTYSWGVSDGYSFSAGAWERWAVTLSAGGLATFYINGVAVGTKSGTLRSPASMTAVHYGPAAGDSYHSVAGACSGVLSAANIAALHAWMLSAA
jgi:hypothetical protein